MSKYVKELMMDQLRSDLDGSRSLLILDLKGLDAVAEHQFRRDLRKKSIRVRALKNSLARRVFTDMGMDGLSRYLEGPSVAVWGATGSPSWPRRSRPRSRNSRSPQIKGGAVDGVVVGPDQVEDITKLPSREALIGRWSSLVLAPAQRIVSAGQRRRPATSWASSKPCPKGAGEESRANEARAKAEPRRANRETAARP